MILFVLSLQFHILFKRCKDLLSAPFLIPSPGSSSCVSVLSPSLSFYLSLHPSLSSPPPPHSKPPPVTQESPHSFPLPCTPLPAAGIWGGGGMLGWEITNTSSAPQKQRDAGSCPPPPTLFISLGLSPSLYPSNKWLSDKTPQWHPVWDIQVPPILQTVLR